MPFVDGLCNALSCENLFFHLAEMIEFAKPKTMKVIRLAINGPAKPGGDFSMSSTVEAATYFGYFSLMLSTLIE